MSKYDIFILVGIKGKREWLTQDAVVRAFRNFNPAPTYVKGGDARDLTNVGFVGVGFIIDDVVSDFDAADKAVTLFDRAKEHLADSDLQVMRWYKTPVGE
jgi:hypothetical protein